MRHALVVLMVWMAFPAPGPVSETSRPSWQAQSEGFVAKPLYTELPWANKQFVHKLRCWGGLSWMVAQGSPLHILKPTAHYTAGHIYLPETPVCLSLGEVRAGATGGPETLKVVETGWDHVRLAQELGGRPAVQCWLSRLSPAMVLDSDQRDIYVFCPPAERDQTVFGFSPAWAALAAGDKTTVVPLKDAAVPLPGPIDWLLLWQGKESKMTNSCLPRTTPYIATSFGHWMHKEQVRAQSTYAADLPVLLVFQNSPASIARQGNGAIALRFTSAAGRIAMMPLDDYAFPRAEHTEAWGRGLPDDVVARCRDWTRLLLQVPVSVKETWELDEKADTVTITNQFTYLPLRGERDGERFAPLPPMLCVAQQHGFPIEIQPTPSDTGLMTYCGPYCGVKGAGSHAVRIRGTARYWREEAQVRRPSANAGESQLVAKLAPLAEAAATEGPFAPWATHIGVIQVWPEDAAWLDPAEQISYPMSFYPVLPEEQRNRMLAHIRKCRKQHPPESVMLLPWNAGTRREWNAASHAAETVADRMSKAHQETGPARRGLIPLDRLYTMERYWRMTGNADERKGQWETMRNILLPYLNYQDWPTAWQFAHPKDHAVFGTMVVDERTFRSGSEVNGSLAGLIGAARLADQVGDKQTGDLAKYLLAKKLALRYAMDKLTLTMIRRGLVKTDPIRTSRDNAMYQRNLSYYQGAGPEDDPRSVVSLDENGLVLSVLTPHSPRGAWVAGLDRLVPEVARFLKDHLLHEVRRAVDCIETTAPDCYASFHRATIGALGDHTNTDLPQVGYACFLARAWILDTPPDRLASPEMLDYPRLRVADWYYMSRLAEAIKVYRGWDWRPVGLP